MTEVNAETPPTATETPPVEPKKTEESVPYDRFQQANKKAKDAADRAKQLEKDMADLRAQMEARETAGLPELEQAKKRAEQLEKRAAEAEAKAAEADTRLARSARERWVVAAAQAQGFADPSDAAAFVDLDGIDDEKDAERAVKRLAAQKKHLLKAPEPVLPGRVLHNGQPAPAAAASGINLTEEARMVSDSLKEFMKNR
jgi:DNA repair exonuclease SbcCD ATPase subunit